jgi:hypothetical protein
VQASTQVTITATDDLTSTVEVGSVAITLGLTGASLGVGLGKNLISTDAFASVEDSNIVALGGGIDIVAVSDHLQDDIQTIVRIISVSATLAGIAGAGGDAVTEIASTVEAFASSADLTATGVVKVDADSTHFAEPDIFGLSASTSISVPL